MDNCGRSESFGDIHTFEKIISLENLFISWKEFKRGKTKRPDVQKFEMFLEDNLFALHKELEEKTYKHSDYTSFYVKDPKLRHIHKAGVRDRIVHHAVYRILYPLFDKCFIYDSYSCRNFKGTHKAVLRFESFTRKVSKNYTHLSFCLKCDIKKFFASIDHRILFNLIKRKINDNNTLWLLEEILNSFNEIKRESKGIPLGNLTSQLFANIYLNELDIFVKHILKEKFYIRYCDDFLILGNNFEHLAILIERINNFLHKKLKLSLHPSKIEIRKLSQGIDFLGYVSLPHYRVLRTKTKRKGFRKLNDKLKKLKTGDISAESFEQVKQSYLGILRHCHSCKLRSRLLKKIQF